jgi:hypothetical protein
VTRALQLALLAGQMAASVAVVALRHTANAIHPAVLPPRLWILVLGPHLRAPRTPRAIGVPTAFQVKEYVYVRE